MVAQFHQFLEQLNYSGVVVQSVPLGGGGSDLRIVARDDPKVVHERF